MRALIAMTSSEFIRAFRNVTRYRRRAAFALVIIVGGVVSFLLAGGFIHWMLDNMREGIIHSQFGHVQIVRPNYFETGVADPYRYLLPENSKIDAEIRKMPEVLAMTPRLAFSGLASFNDATVTFIGDGVDPEGDKQVSAEIAIVSGQALSTDEPNGILLGQGLAANLGVKVGDTMVLMTNTAKGSLNASDVRVRGLFSTYSKEYDDGALRAPISLVRQLLKVKGSTSWVMLLDDTEHTDRVIAALRSHLDAKDFQVVSWAELADFYLKTRDLFLKQVLVVKWLIALIVALSIGNTLYMTVVERTTEIGTVMALGVRKMGILRQFLMEGGILGLFGGGLGVGLGWGLSLLISWIGIPLPPPPGMSSGFDAEILVSPALALDAFVLAVLATLVASLMPAWKAASMNIVDALRRQH